MILINDTNQTMTQTFPEEKELWLLYMFCHASYASCVTQLSIVFLEYYGIEHSMCFVEGLYNRVAGENAFSFHREILL